MGVVDEVVVVVVVGKWERFEVAEDRSEAREDSEGEEAEVDAEWSDGVTAGSTLGNEPPERKEGHSERSSGSEAGCLPMKDNMAAAYEKKDKVTEGKSFYKTYLEQLNLLMFAQYELGCFPPLTSMFPTMFV